jgi:DNA-binding CsgD family transcriptional regulator
MAVFEPMPGKGSSFEQEPAMTEWDIPDLHDEAVTPIRRSQAPVIHFETPVPLEAPIGLLDGGVDSDSPRWPESSPEEAMLDTLGQCTPCQNPPGASLPKFRLDSAWAWRSMLALQIDEALRMMERLELQLDDLPSAKARGLRVDTQPLCEAGLAFLDGGLLILPIALSLLKKGEPIHDDHAALTLCRLRFWRLGKFDTVCLLPRLESRSREAVAVLRQLNHNALEKQDLYVGCGLSVELAEILAATRGSEEADALFFHTIKAAAVAGLFQVFLEGEPGFVALLRRAYTRAASPVSVDPEVLPFVGSLLSRWRARCEGSPPEQPSRRARDTLTARERDVLAMISHGFANKRIARTLRISPETVKSHVKRIFSKLAVSTRAEAVSRAGALGLL